MTTIKAIETSYAGCRFRSRLEARWAVFFDALGIKWEYEAQGYVVGTYKPRPYLPDFWLPETETWVEVKGSDAAIDWDFLADACDYDSALPGIQDSYDTSRGMLLLGPIPAGALTTPWRHIGVQHYKGVIARYFYFSYFGSRATLMSAEYPVSPGYGEGAWGWHWCSGNSGHICGEAGISMGSWSEEGTPLDCGGPGQAPSIAGVPYRNPYIQLAPRIANAYAAARSARFEFHQQGAPR